MSPWSCKLKPHPAAAVASFHEWTQVPSYAYCKTSEYNDHIGDGFFGPCREVGLSSEVKNYIIWGLK